MIKIGDKVKGFDFSHIGDETCGWATDMEEYIGVEGVVIYISEHGRYIICSIRFSDGCFTYPFSKKGIPMDLNYDHPFVMKKKWVDDYIIGIDSCDPRSGGNGLHTP